MLEALSLNYKNLDSLLDSNSIEFNYQGEVQNNKANGYGKAVYKNGSEYCGFFVDNKRQGFGIIKYKDSTEFKGEWIDDKKDGYGVTTLSQNRIMKASYKNDTVIQQANILYLNGDIYIGEVANNLENGFGTKYFNHRIVESNNDGKQNFSVSFYINGQKTKAKNKYKKEQCLQIQQLQNGYWKKQILNFKSENNPFYYDGQTKQGLAHGIGRIMNYYIIIFTGCFKNNKFCDYGEYYYSNGDSYVGEWQDDNRDGFSMYKSKQGDYQGNYSKDKRTGFGEFTYPNGNVYYGEWDNDVKSGFGIQRYVNKFSSLCRYQNNQQYGKCIIIYDSGEHDQYYMILMKSNKYYKYKGHIVNGQANGIGISWYSDGSTYIGEFHNNERYGCGVIKWSDGNKYQGQWCNDEQSGLGQYQWSTGTIHIGTWMQNKQNGYGIQYSLVGYRTEGEWKDGKMNGFGIKYRSDGSARLGVISNDTPVGDFYRMDIDKSINQMQKIFYTCDEDKNKYEYIGQCVNNIPNGIGMQIYKDGNKFQGEFKMGKRHGFGIEEWSGDKYQGYWQDNKLNGFCIKTYESGDTICGNQINNERNGVQKHQYKNGNYYVCEQQKNKINGYCITYFTNGDVKFSKFQSGKHVGISKLYHNQQWHNVETGTDRSGNIFDISIKFEKKRITYVLAKYENGAVYTGQFNNNMRNGYGQMHQSNGDIYEGQWKDDQKCGFGRFEWENGRKCQCMFKDNKRSGYGFQWDDNGNRYEGDWKDGKRNGNGKVFYQNGDSKTGNYHENQPVGKFMKTYKDGSKHDVECYHINGLEFDYIGQKKYGVANGCGRAEYDNGDIYEGQFLYKYRHGIGLMQYKNGSIYYGQWKLNKKCGYGTLIRYDTDTYNGIFLDDSKNGYGVMIYETSATICTCEWSNDHKNGYMVLQYKTGEIVQGIYKDGQSINKFVLIKQSYRVNINYFTNSQQQSYRYIGEVRNGMANGMGVAVFDDGTVYVGQFVDNNMQGYGKLQKLDSSIYTGQFQANELSGLGIQQFSSGDRYEGSFLCGKFNGFGTFFHKNQDKVICNWKNGQRNGFGLIVFGNLDKKYVQFKEDTEIKIYKMVYSNGAEWKGRKVE